MKSGNRCIFTFSENKQELSVYHMIYKPMTDRYMTEERGRRRGRDDRAKGAKIEFQHCLTLSQIWKLTSPEVYRIDHESGSKQ